MVVLLYYIFIKVTEFTFAALYFVRENLPFQFSQKPVRDGEPSRGYLSLRLRPV